MTVVFGIYLRGNNVHDKKTICKEQPVTDHGEKSTICKSAIIKRKSLRDIRF